jgi:hypothetical protein
VHPAGIVVLVVLGLIGLLSFIDHHSNIGADTAFAGLGLIGAFAAFLELTNLLSGQGF